LGSIDAHFLTHFHSDHTVGIPDLWLTGWLPPSYGRRASPFVIYGPVGTRTLMDGLEKAFADDIKIRLTDEKNPLQGIAVEAHEFVERVSSTSVTASRSARSWWTTAT